MMRECGQMIASFVFQVENNAHHCIGAFWYVKACWIFSEALHVCLCMRCISKVYYIAVEHRMYERAIQRNNIRKNGKELKTPFILAFEISSTQGYNRCLFIIILRFGYK